MKVLAIGSNATHNLSPTDPSTSCITHFPHPVPVLSVLGSSIALHAVTWAQTLLSTGVTAQVWPSHTPPSPGRPTTHNHHHHHRPPWKITSTASAPHIGTLAATLDVHGSRRIVFMRDTPTAPELLEMHDTSIEQIASTATLRTAVSLGSRVLVFPSFFALRTWVELPDDAPDDDEATGRGAAGAIDENKDVYAEAGKDTARSEPEFLRVTGLAPLSGYTGPRTHDTPRHHDFRTAITALRATATGFLALDAVGQVHTWGDARFPGVLGRDVTDEEPADRPALVTELLGLRMTRVTACAGGFGCGALSEGGEAWTWGGVGAPGSVSMGFEGLGMRKVVGPWVRDEGEGEGEGEEDVEDLVIGLGFLAVLVDGKVWVRGSIGGVTGEGTDGWWEAGGFEGRARGLCAGEEGLLILADD